jgi:oligoribonuclease
MAWVDVESTGLEPELDHILEIGLIITDDDLNEVARWSGTIWTPNSNLTRLYDNEIVRSMHTKNGLLEAVKSDEALELAKAQQELLMMMDPYSDVPMCGSSVHFDRAMLRRWLPAFEACFHYRNIDVSTVKELVVRWWPSLVLRRPEDRKLHRVIPDIEDSIAELGFYRNCIDNDLLA